MAFTKEPYLHILRLPLAQAIALDEEVLGVGETADEYANECQQHYGGFT